MSTQKKRSGPLPAKLISAAEAAQIIGFTLGTLAVYRITGKGPPFYRQSTSRNARVLYDPDECVAYRESRMGLHRVERGGK